MQIVWGVRSGSEVDRHGVLQLGDTIMAVGQHLIRREEDLLAILELYNLGEVVDMTVQQGKHTRTVKVELLFDRLDPKLDSLRMMGFV
jgi:S1-C subfamily serine protease